VQNRFLLFLADEVCNVVGRGGEGMYPLGLQRGREVDLRRAGIHRARVAFLEPFQVALCSSVPRERCRGRPTGCRAGRVEPCWASGTGKLGRGRAGGPSGAITNRPGRRESQGCIRTRACRITKTRRVKFMNQFFFQPRQDLTRRCQRERPSPGGCIKMDERVDLGEHMFRIRGPSPSNRQQLEPQRKAGPRKPRVPGLSSEMDRLHRKSRPAAISRSRQQRSSACPPPTLVSRALNAQCAQGTCRPPYPSPANRCGGDQTLIWASTSSASGLLLPLHSSSQASIHPSIHPSHPWLGSRPVSSHETLSV
jgi:hypothetical protein